jgi:TonB family protein
MRNILLAAFFISANWAFCQTVPPPKVDTYDSNVLKEDGPIPPDVPELTQEENKIYSVVEQNAEYKEGSAALMKFIATNIRYPEEAKEIGIQGKVYLQFVVRIDGSLSDIKVVRSVSGGPMLDREAVRVLKLTSGKWNPAKQNGRAVNCSFILPVNFVLQD